MAQANGETTLQQRLEIVERAKAGESDAEIAQALSYSVWTVRKWRRQERDHGRAGLSPKQGRPATGALGTASPEIREAVRTMRQANPGWGPETIRIELGQDERFRGQPIPSRPRIAAFLKQEGLTRRYERHSELAQPPPATATVAHEEWELDAQGVVKVDGIGSVCVINISDLVSRIKVGGQVCIHCTKPSTPDYQLACRLAFLRYVGPERGPRRHERPYFNAGRHLAQRVHPRPHRGGRGEKETGGPGGRTLAFGSRDHRPTHLLLGLARHPWARGSTIVRFYKDPP